LTSDRKAKANRANARISTGPNTFHGRARSARNAFRHGLSLPVQSDQALGEEVQALARQIAGPNASAQIQMLACRVAEAEVDLRRVRLARHQLLSQALSNPLYDSQANRPEKMTAIARLPLANAFEMTMAAREKVIPSTPQGANNIAISLSREAKALAAMDRYERRARSRRKFAIRAFDMARNKSRMHAVVVH
jgi:hypothetical protein